MTTSADMKKGWDKNCAIYNCSDGEHLSFWQAIVRQPEWELWCKEVARRMQKKLKNVYDVDECSECGWMSKEHAKAFLSFIKTLRDK